MPRTSASALSASAPKFRAALLGWYRINARKLPWRHAPSVYKTVVSELMLQQTQVKTVLPYFARWLTALPDFSALARASESEVLKLWEGLGYYSRARNLHRLAQAIVAQPATPRTVAEWQELPGVGPYTAAAVTSISFGVPAACVDGNVVRILARLTADPTPFRDSAQAAKQFAPLAQSLVSPDKPGDHNQAMMELGATVCFRHNPLCSVCPVLRFCAAGRAGNPQAYPRLAAKQMEQTTVTRLWCERDGALLLHRAPASARRFANMYELPTAEAAGFTAATAARGQLLAKKRRGITRFHITEHIYVSPPNAVGKTPGPDVVWVPVAQLDTITLSGPHRRWVNEILADRQTLSASLRRKVTPGLLANARRLM